MATETCDEATERRREKQMVGCACGLLLLPMAIWLCQLFVGEFITNPARQSPEAIKAELLAATPLGCDSKRIQTYILSRWGREGTTFVGAPDSHDVRGHGILVCYGSYTNLPRDYPSATDVMVYWILDDQDRLETIIVRRSNVGP
jgi:hypothetical protein